MTMEIAVYAYFWIGAVVGFWVWIYMGFNPRERSMGVLILEALFWPVSLVVGIILGIRFIIEKSFTNFD